MAPCIDTLLLLALPASGKSVLQRYLATLSPELVESEFHLGSIVQLDDFPYVHLMWRISEVMGELGVEPTFFDFAGGQLRDLRDWGTLVHLLNEDYAALTAPRPRAVTQAGRWIMERLTRARGLAELPAPFSHFDQVTRTAVATAIENEAAPFAARWSARSRPLGSTVVIEFARGGPEDAHLPLESPYGYAYSLSLLSEEILRSAAVLYVWATPEDSRRRNRQRVQPGAEGSSLHHGVPEAVMRTDFGIDDMEWLIDHSEHPGTISVPAHGSVYQLPVACFDNRRDLTLFQLDDPSNWPTSEVEAVHAALSEAFTRLVAQHP
jgi:hypothetical protein